MQRIDLHTHSSASDGTLSPRRLVRAAVEADLAAIALTDHDTIAGLREAQAAGDKFGVEVIAGVELSAEVAGRTCHILGYFIDRTDAGLRRALRRMARGRRERNPLIVAKLNALGVPLRMSDVEALAGGRIVGRPHIAAALVAAGLVKSKRRAVEKWLARGKNAYVERFRMMPGECIQTIREAGGVAVLAHPALLGFRQAHQLAAFIDELAALGLGGIECFHSEHRDAQTATYLSLARNRSLAVTGGSDFHGHNKSGIRLGVGRGRLCVPASLLGALRAACRRPR